MAFFDDLKDKATDLGRAGMAKSKQLMEITKLSLNNSGEEDAIRKAYLEIGKLYYAERGGHRSPPMPPSASALPPPRSTLRKTKPVSLRSRRTAPCPTRMSLRPPHRLKSLTIPWNKTTKALRPTGGGLFASL